MTEMKEEDNASTVSTISVKDETNHTIKVSGGADFETAISATGFGLFNLLLLLTTIPSILTSQFELSSLSFVFPAAQCDLNLSLEDKGVINAIIYTGMIASCFFWGSLTDVYGRRKILIVTLYLDSICAIMAAFSFNFSMLAATKFFGGFIINGPSMALTPYLSEFHGTKYRSRVPLTIGLLYSFGNIAIPLLAWAVLPLNLNFSFFEGIEFHAWNIFLILCAVPAFISAIGFTFMPESPKYTMTKGDNDTALQVFRKIYKMNMKSPRQCYPIDKLLDEQQISQKKKGVKEAWKQISPLFSLKYASKLIIVCLLVMCLMLCINTLRLWLPEIFQILNDYEYYNNKTATFCEMLNSMKTDADSTAQNCYVNFDNDSVYINSVVVGASSVCGYIAATFLINKLGKKKILCCLGFVSGISIVGVYFSPNSLLALILICIHLTCACVCIDVVIIIIIDLFPTYLRATALSLAMMCGRIGSVFGNLLFPYLLQAGCAPPFFTLGSIIIGCTITSLFLPNTDFKALE